MAGASGGQAPASPLERIKARREQLKGKTTIDLVIPGQPDLGVRFRAVDDTEMQKWADRFQRARSTDDGTTGVDVALDLILATQVCVLVREADGELHELRATDEGEPLKIDLDLGEHLGFEFCETARAVARELFSPGGANPMSPVPVGDAIVAWLQGNERSIDKALLGE